MTSPVGTPAERALDRMRRYTTLSLVFVVVTFVVLGVIQSQTVDDATLRLFSTICVLVAGLAAAVIMAFWERPASPWIVAPVLAVAIAAWALTIVFRGYPGVALPVALAVALVVTQARRYRAWWALAGGALLAGPVIVAWAIRPAESWQGWLGVALFSYVLAVGLFVLNNYAWGLYLEIDAARRGAADLAVAQERFRFAADLHDIQGHTLHVIRLKTQLARKLLDTNPEAARVHLLEAETLIGETLANTRSLAFGDREVALAAEVANAQALFVAAGIQCDVDGDPGAAVADELFGLAMRETTTNILRHAQATHVQVTIAPNRLVIENNGSPDRHRPPSGLARLGERFEAAGGALRTRSHNGVFTTEAVAG